MTHSSKKRMNFAKNNCNKYLTQIKVVNQDRSVIELDVHRNIYKN